eukprot:TRINITY_DN7338_c0_g1_i1.p1 TRINITY_DN7338_c0_g1~~TRINITY_DN7338_c0_g1_i1.p1  ORF type:complete len:363 (-),score=62.42 TRINITY_DN7338_c0_g1_i1:70-1050(-)
MEGTDDDVAATNDDAAHSKAMAVGKGYFKDPYLNFFVRKPKWSPPLMNRGTAARAILIRSLMDKFLAPFIRGGPGGGAGNRSGERCQVVVYGAGFDTNYFRVASSIGAQLNVAYFEVDFQNVIAAKKRVILGTSELSDLVPGANSGGEHLISPTYSLLAADLRNLPALTELLSQSGFQRDVPTLFLSEAVLMYTNPVDSEALIRWSAGSSPSSMFVIYEPFSPTDSFGRKMIENLKRRGVPLASIEKYPTLEAQNLRFRECGYPVVESRTMLDMYPRLFDQTEQRRIARLEMMDEFEEFNLLMSHYCVVVGLKQPSDKSTWSSPLL